MRGWRGCCVAIPMVGVLLGCAGSGPPVPRFPLTSDVLRALRSARPHALRFDDAQRHASCDAQDTLALLPHAGCTALPEEVSQALAALASRVARALRAGQSTDAMWASALLDLATDS